MEFGFLFKDQLSLQQCAREGARTASVGKMTTEVDNRIVTTATTLASASLTYDVMHRTYDPLTSAWSAWVTLGNQPGDSGKNDAPQGAQIRVRTHYVHRLLTGPLFARMIGQPGATSITLHAEMVMRRE